MKYLTILLAFLLAATSQAQTLQGTIIDQETGEAMIFANVILEKRGKLELGTTTDFDGNYSITGFDSGVYDLRIKYIGYLDTLVSKIKINVGETSTIDVSMRTDPSSLLGNYGFYVPKIIHDEIPSKREIRQAKRKNKTKRHTKKRKARI